MTHHTSGCGSLLPFQFRLAWDDPLHSDLTRLVSVSVVVDTGLVFVSDAFLIHFPIKMCKNMIITTVMKGFLSPPWCSVSVSESSQAARVCFIIAPELLLHSQRTTPDSSLFPDNYLLPFINFFCFLLKRNYSFVPQKCHTFCWVALEAPLHPCGNFPSHWRTRVLLQVTEELMRIMKIIHRKRSEVITFSISHSLENGHQRSVHTKDAVKENNLPKKIATTSKFCSQII